MKYYLLATSAAGAENLPEKYKKKAKSESCFYTRSIPEEYLNDAPDDWPQDSAEKIKIGYDIVRRTVKNHEGEYVQWIAFDYPSERYYIENVDLEELVNLAEGQVNVYGRGMKNSTRFFEDEECEAFLGMPDIGDAMILEFIDDGLEAELYNNTEEQ